MKRHIVRETAPSAGSIDHSPGLKSWWQLRNPSQLQFNHTRKPVETHSPFKVTIYEDCDTEKHTHTKKGEKVVADFGTSLKYTLKNLAGDPKQMIFLAWLADWKLRLVNTVYWKLLGICCKVEWTAFSVSGVKKIKKKSTFFPMIRIKTEQPINISLQIDLCKISSWYYYQLATLYKQNI